jgi:hypothetical protein
MGKYVKCSREITENHVVAAIFVTIHSTKDAETPNYVLRALNTGN